MVSAKDALHLKGVSFKLGIQYTFKYETLISHELKIHILFAEVLCILEIHISVRSIVQVVNS